MRGFLFFIVGYLLGSISGVMCMCLVQFKKINKFPEISEEIEKEKHSDTLSYGLPDCSKDIDDLE